MNWIHVLMDKPPREVSKGIITPHKLSINVLTINGWGEVSVGCYNYDEDLWSTESIGDITGDFYAWFFITHWMYLPEPPKDKNRQN